MQHFAQGPSFPCAGLFGIFRTCRKPVKRLVRYEQRYSDPSNRPATRMNSHAISRLHQRGRWSVQVSHLWKLRTVGRHLITCRPHWRRVWSYYYSLPSLARRSLRKGLCELCSSVLALILPVRCGILTTCCYHSDSCKLDVIPIETQRSGAADNV